jgi:hypothetical protein
MLAESACPWYLSAFRVRGDVTRLTVAEAIVRPATRQSTNAIVPRRHAQKHNRACAG